MIIILKMLKEMGAKKIELLGNSQLAIKQLTEEYKFKSFVVALYYTSTK